MRKTWRGETAPLLFAITFCLHRQKYNVLQQCCMRGKFDEKKIFYVRAHFGSQSWLPLFILFIKSKCMTDPGSCNSNLSHLKQTVLEWLEETNASLMSNECGVKGTRSCHAVPEHINKTWNADLNHLDEDLQECHIAGYAEATSNSCELNDTSSAHKSDVGQWTWPCVWSSFTQKFRQIKNKTKQQINVECHSKNTPKKSQIRIERHRKQDSVPIRHLCICNACQ